MTQGGFWLVNLLTTRLRKSIDTKSLEEMSQRRFPADERRLLATGNQNESEDPESVPPHERKRREERDASTRKHILQYCAMETLTRLGCPARRDQRGELFSAQPLCRAGIWAIYWRAIQQESSQGEGCPDI